MFDINRRDFLTGSAKLTALAVLPLGLVADPTYRITETGLIFGAHVKRGDGPWEWEESLFDGGEIVLASDPRFRAGDLIDWFKSCLREGLIVPT